MFLYSDDEEEDDDVDEDSDEEMSGDSSDDDPAVSADEEMQDAPVVDEFLENMPRGAFRCFVLNLYNETCDVEYAALGVENDVEEFFFMECMIRARQEVGLSGRFSVLNGDIPKLRGVVMRMVRRHKGAGLTFEQWHYWTMQMQRAVKWQYENDADPEDDTPVQYSPLTLAQTIHQQWQARKRARVAAREAAGTARSAYLAVWQPGGSS